MKNFVKVGENMLTGSNQKLKLRQTSRHGLLGLKSWIINKVRKPSKKRLSFSWKEKIKDDDIEILDVDEKESHAKRRFKFSKIRSKKQFAIGTVAVLVLSIFTLLILPGQNIIKISARKFLDSLGIYTQEIKSVEIQSDDYNNPGSWHIDKSAKWIGLNKAQVTFDVNSVMKTNGNYEDIILVIDVSGSMSGSKLEKAINDSKELVSYVLSNTNNRVAIITFDSTSTIVSEFSNEKDELLKKLDAIVEAGATNYNAGLQNVNVIMNGYVKESNRDIVALFLTDGYPNEDTPNQIGTYESLKDKYPYMMINGIQYEMGTSVIDEIKQITDLQWVADQSTLNNVLFEASISPEVYEDFIVTDYINEKFKVNSVDDIKVTIGTVALTAENGLQKITWNLGKNSYMTGGNAKMYINLTLKEEYAEIEGLFPTNNKEMIESKLSDEATKIVNSTNAPILKNVYEIVYDTNPPEGCTLPSISNEKYFAYQNVTRKTDKLSCNGYLFKGWEIDGKDSEDIIKVNDDIFKMPLHDITIRATWTRQSIAKSMDGTVYEKPTLYKILEEAAKAGTYAKEYTGGHKDSFIEDSTQKIYHWYGSNSVNGTAILDKNNVIFAGHCWQMIRTTDTGGVKMIYNGEAENNQCLDIRGTHVGYSRITRQSMSTAYYYGTSYNYDSTAKSFTLTGTVTTGTIKTGQYTCMQTSADATCTTLYYVDTLSSGTNYYVLPLNTNSYYSQFGELEFSVQSGTLADAGYMYNTRHYLGHKEVRDSSHYVFDNKREDLSTSYWYADEVSYDSTAGVYSLINPYKVSSSADYSKLVGKYTFRSSTETYTNSSVYYIAVVEASSYMHYIVLYSGNDLAYYNDTYTYGDSYTDNGDGTYTINNAKTIEKKDFGIIKYSDLKKKFICKNAINNTCEYPWYIMYAANAGTVLGYIDMNSTSSIYKYAKDFEYKIDPDDGIYKYFLNDAITGNFWDIIADDPNKLILSNAHYTCFNTSGKCEKISYVVALNDFYLWYININDGKSVEDVKNEMLYDDDVNTKNSVIKTGIDLWFEKYLLDYSDYLEDTIFCNDRSQSNSDINAWNPNGGSILTRIEFYGSNDLGCPNVTDRFSILNEKARLKYKVGLMSYREMNLLGNNNVRKSRDYYWLISPGTYSAYNPTIWDISGRGSLGRYSSPTSANGVRPAISLKPGTEYVDGDGSMASPYIVETNN